jgi:prolyl-tRNA synthetase
LGPRDIESGEVVVARRFLTHGLDRKVSLSIESVAAEIPSMLDGIQSSMLAASRDRREAGSRRGFDSYDDFRVWIEESPGLAYAGWCGAPTCSERAKTDASVTIRVAPDEEFRSDERPATCLVCGEAATDEVVWAKAY